MTSKERATRIDRGIRLVWASLESHLKWAHEAYYDVGLKTLTSCAFHKKCVKEYSELIKILSELY